MSYTQIELQQSSPAITIWSPCSNCFLSPGGKSETTIFRIYFPVRASDFCFVIGSDAKLWQWCKTRWVWCETRTRSSSAVCKMSSQWSSASAQSPMATTSSRTTALQSRSDSETSLRLSSFTCAVGLCLPSRRWGQVRLPHLLRWLSCTDLHLCSLIPFWNHNSESLLCEKGNPVTDFIHPRGKESLHFHLVSFGCCKRLQERWLHPKLIASNDEGSIWSHACPLQIVSMVLAKDTAKAKAVEARSILNFILFRIASSQVGKYS